LHFRIKCHVMKDEDIKYIDFCISYQNKILIICFSLILVIEPLIFGLLSSFGGVLFGFNLMLFGLIATIIVIPTFILCNRLLDLLCSVNIVIFTDMAIYFSRLDNNIKIKESLLHRLPYAEIKAYSFGIKGILRFPPKLTVTLYTAFDIASKYYEIKFAGEIDRKKQVFESFIHAYHPPSIQAAKYFEKKGKSGQNRDKIHQVSPKILHEIQRTKKTLKFAGLIVDPVIIFAGILIILAIFGSTSPRDLSVFFTWYIGAIFLLVMVLVMVSQLKVYGKLSSFHASEDANLKVNDIDLEFQDSATSINLPFQPTSLFIPSHSVKMKRYDYISASTIESIKKDVKFGPVDDLLELYYDIMVNYYSWLESKEYFLVPDDIAIIYVKSQKEMSSIAEKLLLQKETRVSISAIEARTNFKEQLDTIDDIKLETTTLDESKQTLKYPVEKYLDHVEKGEEICFIHHPARSRAQVEELVLTTKGIIVVRGSIFGTPFKIMYDDILSVNPGKISPDGKTFTQVILNIHTKSNVEQVLLDHPMERGARILQEVKEESHVIIGAIPVDSLLFGILKKIGNVPIIV